VVNAISTMLWPRSRVRSLSIAPNDPIVQFGRRLPVRVLQTLCEVGGGSGRRPRSGLARDSLKGSASRLSFPGKDGHVVLAVARSPPAPQQPVNNYDPATPASQTFAILMAGQFIIFDPLSDRIYDDPPFAVDANASSGLPVSAAANGACTAVGLIVTLTGAGSCTVTASQASNAASSSWSTSRRLTRSTTRPSRPPR
jgi:hypothetical protein